MDHGFGGRQKKKKRKKTRKSSRKVKQEASNINVIHEVSLNDFANAPDTKGALKKISKKMIFTPCSGSNGLSKLTEKLNINQGSSNADDFPWFERSDFDDIETEYLNDIDSEDLENDENESTKLSVDTSPRIPQTQPPDSGGKTYPFDVWCLLSTYIMPEQIRTFSEICRGSYESVNCVRFWIRLYKKFILDPTCLPARLRPDWIESRPGLKMRIVRALFIGYNNLRNRLQLENIEENRNTQIVYSQLVGLRCCRVWYQNEATSAKPVYTFYFKFKQESRMVSSSLFSSERDDYLGRTDENCFTILQMSMANFILLDYSVCGEILTDISVNLSRNMRCNCVKLVFHYFRKDGRYRKEEGTKVTLDPVTQIRLLRWWHPSYPRGDDE